jgi:hypothetical protein
MLHVSLMVKHLSVEKYGVKKLQYGYVVSQALSILHSYISTLHRLV